MKVSITKQDIALSLSNPGSNPVIRAVTRATGNTAVIIEDRPIIFVNETYYDLPAIAISFLKDFRSRTKVQPVEFEL